MVTTAVATRPSVPAQRETIGEMVVRLAAEEHIPPSGITILGGNPYINVTGLDCKLRHKCESEKLIHAGTEYVPVMEATKENGMRAGGWGIVRLFDKRGFEKALEAAGKSGPITKEILDTLKELYYYTFKMRGFASPETLKTPNMKLKDNIEHMAERRATNRAKREATGTGLTSVDEMSDAPQSETNGHGDVPPVTEPPPIDWSWLDDYAAAIDAAGHEDQLKLAEFNARGHFDKLDETGKATVKARLVELKARKEAKIKSLASSMDTPEDTLEKNLMLDKMRVDFPADRIAEAAAKVGLRGDSDSWTLKNVQALSELIYKEPW